MDRAEQAALKALPNYPPETYADEDEYIEIESERSMQRAFYREGYAQAEKDLALTWEDVAIIITIYEAGIDDGDYRRYNEAEWMKEYSQDILKRFNEQRKK